jgi:3-deoxy-D-manno-octulosonic acid kinase
MPGDVPGFRRLQRDGALLWVNPRFDEPVHALDLLDPTARERAWRGAATEGGRGPAARLALADGDSLLLRRSLHGGALGPLLGDRWLTLRRPLAELRVTSALRAAGAPVPTPVLALGWRNTGLLWQAAVGTVVEEDTVDARAFLEAAPDPQAVGEATTAAGLAIRRFHDAGGRHADLHLGNLLLRTSPAKPRAVVIDLDKARILDQVTAARRMRELMRLYRSVVKRRLLKPLGPQGVRRFFEAYVGSDRDLGRALLTHLPHELRRLRLHALCYGDSANA